MKTTMRILMAVAAAAVLLAVGTARAANSTWTNTVSANFNNAGSWNSGEPGVADTATFSAGGASYTVTFDHSKTNAMANFVLGGGNVTLDLNAKDYRLPTGPTYGLLANTASDTGTLTIMNGTMHTMYAYGGGFYTGPGITVVVTNGGYVTGTGNASINVAGNLVVDGASSSVFMFDQFLVANLLSKNSSTNFLRSGYLYNATIDNSVVQGWGGLAGNYATHGTINITNGGVYTATQTPHGATTYVTGGYDDGFIWMNVGGGSDMTRTSLFEAAAFDFGRLDNASGSAHLAIFSNGMARVTGNAHPMSGSSNYGSTDFKIQDQQDLTLLGGSIQMTNGSRMTLVDYRTAATPGILRGYGSISRIGSGSFSIQNDGYIRPGDTGTNYDHNVAGLGRIAISNGSLYQTNAVRDGRLYFEFSPTANDQINIANGLARITAGSNFFALATGAPSPRTGEKYGIGTFDFLVATNITYTPAYDNLVNLLTNTYHLKYGVDFQYGVVNLGGGLFALELTFVPEPSTVLLLALGGLMVWRRIAKRSKK